MADVVKTLKSSGGDYSLISTWQSSEVTNLVSAGDTHTLECYNDWPSGLSDSVLILGWITGPSNWLKITAPSTERHNGVPGAGFWLSKDVSGGYIIDNYLSNVFIEYIEVNNTNALGFGMSVRTGDVDGCIASVGNTGTCFNLIQSGGIIKNSVAIAGATGFVMSSFHSGEVYNCVAGGTSTYGFFKSGSSGTPTISNCVAYNNSTDYFNSGSWGAASTNNSTSKAVTTNVPGANKQANIASSDFFDAANDDYHLVAGSNLIGNGADLSGTFTKDIDGQTRSSWDRGIDELIIEASKLTLTGFAPNTRILTDIFNPIPIGNLKLTGFAPSSKTKRYHKVPSGNLYLTGIIPRSRERIPGNYNFAPQPGYIRLTGLLGATEIAPNVRINKFIQPIYVRKINVNGHLYSPIGYPTDTRALPSWVNSEFLRISGAFSNLELEDWHLLGDLGEPTLQNSWVDFGSGETVGFYRDPFYSVHIRGRVKDGTTTDGTTIFTLPEAYWPQNDVTVTSISKSGGGTYDSAYMLLIDTSGNIKVYGLAASTEVVLNCQYRLDNY